MNHITLTHDKLSVDQISNEAADESCGAISLFVGTTRDNFNDKKVVKLEYEAYEEMAKKEMDKICNLARKKWELKHICLYHRLGTVPVKEASVVIAVSSTHRKESLEAVGFLIDSLKASVPIWKKEMYDDGSGDWKKNKECTWGADNNNTSNKKTLDSDDESVNKKRRLELSTSSQDLEETADKLEVTINTECEKEIKNDSRIDPKFVQITASKSEINRRIEAIMKRKREELNIINVQEFCQMSNGINSEDSCARTSAVLKRSQGSKSHLKLKKVVNEWGPQTVHANELTNYSTSGQETKDALPDLRNTTSDITKKRTCQKKPLVPIGIDERLNNLETHLNIDSARSFHKDLYVRLKEVEDKVLFLESLSPEYFTFIKNKNKDENKEVKQQYILQDDLTFDELDQDIYKLKIELKQKQLNKIIL